MSLLPPAQAEEQLSHWAPEVAQWRNSRTTPRGRIPQSLWAQAVALAHSLPLARVAQQLGLTPQALKRRGGGQTPASVPPPLPASRNLEEVTPPAWRAPTAEGEGQRAAGARRRLTSHAATPALVPLLQTGLARRGCSTSLPKAASGSPSSPAISAKALLASPPSGARGWARIPGPAPSPSSASGPAHRSNACSTPARDFGSVLPGSPQAASTGGPPPPLPAGASPPGS